MNEMQNATSFDDAMPHSGREEERSAFLLEEGLELLANYRAIDNKAIRAQVRTLVAVLAGASR